MNECTAMLDIRGQQMVAMQVWWDSLGALGQPSLALEWPSSALVWRLVAEQSSSLFCDQASSMSNRPSSAMDESPSAPA